LCVKPAGGGVINLPEEYNDEPEENRLEHLSLFSRPVIDKIF
jgi:hypothetical protein